jgi:curli biogenesis system outer membrane secretion channel CsgG
MMSRRLVLWVPVLGLAAFLLSGCQSPNRRSGYHYSVRGGQVTKPVVAVIDFENKANVSGRWNLGEGMADLLIAELIDSRDVTVLERKNLGDVVNEIAQQGRELFRQEGKVQRGRLKNARYLVRGTVTDFTESMHVSGWLGLRSWRIFGGGNRARVAIAVRVSEVESGEVVSSVKAEASVGSGGGGVEGMYKDVAFGGDAFFRTPLGQATEAAVEHAVRKILRDLPRERWDSRVASVSEDYVVVNGGKNVRVRRGREFLVREGPREVTDPVTGNVIDVVPGKVVGRVKVREVNDESSYADLLEGVARRGDCLEEMR